MNKKIALILILIFFLFGCNNNIEKINLTYISDDVLLKKVTLEDNELFIPEKEGYNFSGWYYDREFFDKYLFDTIIEKDTYLYAKWIESSDESLFNYKEINENEVEIIEFNNLLNISKKIVVPQILSGKKVISINGIFENNETIEEIILPIGLKVIGDKTFANMASLEFISIPNTVEDIGEYAFYKTLKLKHIILPGSIKNMGKGLLQESGIEQAVLEEGITSIPAEMFNECVKLINVDISNTVKEIGNAAFLSCYKLRTLKIPEGVTSIKVATFFQCGLVEINLLSSLKEIENSAFMDCNMVKILVIPKGVHTIGAGVFSFIGFEAVYIPEGIENMGSLVFSNTVNKIYYEGDEIPKFWPQNWAHPDVMEKIEYGIYYMK